MKIDPDNTIQFYCTECESPLYMTLHQLSDEPHIKCRCCGHEFSPDADELIETKQKLIDNFEEYKKRLNEG